MNKICKGCKNPFKDMDKNKRSLFCSSCKKVKWRFYRNYNWKGTEKGKKYAKEYAKEYTFNLKKQVFDHYGWRCNCCPEILESMLTIDHVNNDGHKDRKLKLAGASMCKKIIKEGFPDKYQILCMNCNWSKKINKGICQHQIIK